MRFQETAVAVVASIVVFLKTAVAVVLKMTTAIAVITYNFNSTKNGGKKIICITEIQVKQTCEIKINHKFHFARLQKKW